MFYFLCRLPIVQGASLGFLIPTLAILNLPKWECPEEPGKVPLTGSLGQTIPGKVPLTGSLGQTIPGKVPLTGSLGQTIPGKVS